MSYNKETNDNIRVIVNTIQKGYSSIVSNKDKNTKKPIHPITYKNFFDKIEELYTYIHDIKIKKLMDENYKKPSARYLRIAAEILYDKKDKTEKDKEKVSKIPIKTSKIKKKEPKKK